MLPIDKNVAIQLREDRSLSLLRAGGDIEMLVVRDFAFDEQREPSAACPLMPTRYIVGMAIFMLIRWRSQLTMPLISAACVDQGRNAFR